MEPDRFGYSDDNCSVRRTLEIVGERWTPLVLREAYYGSTRFEQFVATIGCPRSVLSDRLAKLVENGMLQPSEYREEGSRTRAEYRLTEMGRDFFPVVLALLRFGDKWLADADGPPIDVVDAESGEPVHVEMRSAGGRLVEDVRGLRAVPGPGLKRAA